MNTDHHLSTRSPSRPGRLNVVLGVAGFVVFVLLAALVHARLLAGFDLAATLAANRLDSPLLDGVAGFFSIAFAAELSLLYAVLASLLLWRRGLRHWAAAPLAFLPLVLIEMTLKLLIEQPAIPQRFHHDVYYPLASLELNGTFPSGHAIRISFFLTFLAVLLAARGGRSRWLAPAGCALLAVLVGLTRVYLGYHWLSDVIAGLALGAATALLVAPPVARRLARDQEQPTAAPEGQIQAD